VTNERKLIHQVKHLNERIDGLYALFSAKNEVETWVSGKVLTATFGLTRFDIRRLRNSGVLKSKGVGNSKTYLLQSVPESLIKKRENADKASSHM